ncbi:unnamed protein product [Kuraishia capsulata CBS 1993]|uniref:PSP1 C-terminal domain-containing protein n=1 Tax=Kuraishia capsulata CBS 1993 TaxID=1382522 RepID=W6MGA0_9ASCO|nr:uncharacterized protein KUCA_T00000768001 [Kuraishia capsulata CBS 1993]CDK24801.1 unnamed protein product [Kuraishia capsulata CBS 1993]
MNNNFTLQDPRLAATAPLMDQRLSTDQEQHNQQRMPTRANSLGNGNEIQGPHSRIDQSDVTLNPYELSTIWTPSNRSSGGSISSLPCMNGELPLSAGALGSNAGSNSNFFPVTYEPQGASYSGFGFNSRRASYAADSGVLNEGSIWSSDPLSPRLSQASNLLGSLNHHGKSSFSGPVPSNATSNLASAGSVATQATNGSPWDSPQNAFPINEFVPPSRRHSYAAVGDNQWLTENFGSGLGITNPTISHQHQNQVQQQQFHSQQQQNQNSAAFGQQRLYRGSSPGAVQDLLREQDQVYSDADSYFTERANRVHVTGKSAVDLPSALAALNQVGVHLPKFPGNTLPGVQLALVSFKAGRVDVFYHPENTCHNLKIGDFVLVEADRGTDLGKVVRLDVSIDEARLLKLRQHQEQQSALSLNGPGNSPPLNAVNLSASQASPPPSLHYPKPLVRFAYANEVSQLQSKQSDEEKAKQVCSMKVKAHGLSMQVVDAEYQWDRRKLTFYYCADHRIDFRDLVKELFRIYKTRIWMCAVNYQHQLDQPPASMMTKHMKNFGLGSDLDVPANVVPRMFPLSPPSTGGNSQGSRKNSGSAKVMGKLMH